DGSNAGVPERLASDRRIGKEALVAQRMTGRGDVEQAFEIAEDYVGLSQRVADAREWNRGVRHLHQVHVAGQHQRRHGMINPVLDALLLDFGRVRSAPGTALVTVTA